ncbi:hypothetical protein FB548_3405 [Pseudoxanthomonas sp. 3HH-4]|nr:hypothetical protein FB548_3405 [Pseudoxanthomonas sp. 3HH-4]
MTKGTLGGWLALVLSCLVNPASAQQEVASLHLEVTGTLQVDGLGAVSGFKADPQVPAALAGLVARGVAQWNFTSPLHKERAIDGDTNVRLALEAVLLQGGYRLRVMDAWFGAPALVSDAPVPDYPRVLLEARAGARVLLQLRIDASGHVAEAAVKDTAVLTHIKNEAIIGKWRERFEQSSLDAARFWTFVPGSTQGAIDVYPEQVLVLVTFWPHETKGNTSYRHIGWPLETSPWAIHNKTTLSPGTVRVDPRVIPLESTLQLKTSAVGNFL